jgi:hypothetical protein
MLRRPPESAQYASGPYRAVLERHGIVITHALCQRRFQALTVARMVPKTVAPGVRRAVSTTVRIAASP